jgi:hypothetical protein
MYREHFDTDTLSLGRRTPRTPAQRLDALAGVEQANRDVHARELTTSDDMIRLGWSPYRRAGYELRWHELISDSSRSGIPRPERPLARRAGTP